MAHELLTALRPVIVAALPGSPSKGDTVVLNSNGHLYTYDGSGWVDNGAAGGGGGGVTGRTVVNFGAGQGMAETVITGLGSILAASSVVRAWLIAEATADHSVDEHRVEQIDVLAGNIVDGVGFSIYARCNRPSYGEWSVAYEVTY